LLFLKIIAMIKRLFFLSALALSISACNLIDLSPANTTYKLISFNMDGTKWLPVVPSGYSTKGSLVDGIVRNEGVSIFAFRVFEKSKVAYQDEFVLAIYDVKGNGKIIINEKTDNVGFF
jgi:hypothetical protein